MAQSLKGRRGVGGEAMPGVATHLDGGNVSELRRGPGRPRKSAPVTASNVSDETIREHADKCAVKKGELETAEEEAKQRRGTYRAALKDAKAAGVDPDAITWWLAARKRDPDEIDRETKHRNRLARIMGLPIGTQLGLDFATGKSVAAGVDLDRLADAKPAPEPAAAYPYNEGKISGAAGRPLANPYASGSANAVLFDDGWKAGQASIAYGDMGESRA